MKTEPRVRGALTGPYSRDYIVESYNYRSGGCAGSMVNQQRKTVDMDPSATGLITYDSVTRPYPLPKGQRVYKPMRRYFKSFEIESWSGPYMRSEQLCSGKVIEYSNSSFTTYTAPPSRYASACDTLPDINKVIQSLKIDAVNAAFAASKQRDVMGLVDIAEMDSTLKLFTSKWGALEKLFRRHPPKPRKIPKGDYYKVGIYWKKRKPNPDYDPVNGGAGLWLEAQYGWIPLLLSMKGLYEALTKQKDDSLQTFRGFDGGQVNETVSGRRTIVLAGYNANHYEDLRVDRHVEIGVRAGVNAAWHPSLRGALGLELADIPSTVYELIPYSFVLDMALNLGTAITALTPVRGEKVEASWATTSVESCTTYTSEMPSGTYTRGNFPIVNDSMRVYYTTPVTSRMTVIDRYKVRDINTKPQLPMLDLRSFKSLTHSISLAALAYQKAIGAATHRR